MKAAGTHLTALELAQVLMTMPMQTEVVIGEDARPITSAEVVSGGRVLLTPAAGDPLPDDVADFLERLASGGLRLASAREQAAAFLDEYL